MDVCGLQLFRGVLKSLSFKNNEQSKTSPLSFRVGGVQALFLHSLHFLFACLLFISLVLCEDGDCFYYAVYFHLYIYFRTCNNGF